MKRDAVSRWTILFGPIVLVAALGLPSQFYYVRISGDASREGNLSEIPHSSASRMISEMQRFQKQSLRPVTVVDTSNIQVAKFASVYINPSSASFPSNDYFSNLVVEYDRLSFVNSLVDWMYPDLETRAHALIERRKQLYRTVSFDMHDAQVPRNLLKAEQTAGGPEYSAGKTIIESRPSQTLLNRRLFAGKSGTTNFELVPAELVRDYLIFVSSELGQSYYTADRARTGLFQLEPDYFFRQNTMAAIGRYLLFNVVNPSDKVRFVVDYTGSLKGDGVNQIPAAWAIGNSRVPFTGLGRGSARVFSEAFEPQSIAGRQYAAIDMGVDGQPFPDHRTGLMGLYGTDIKLEYREPVGFARDISLISDDQYRSLHPPQLLDRFPDSLADKDLEYSGVYEDGWIAEHAYFKLSRPARPFKFVIRADVVDAGRSSFSPELRVSVDGSEILRRTASQGDFEARTPVSLTAGVHRVDVFFDRVQRLLAPDNRLVAVRLKEVGFEEDGAEDIAEDPVRIGDGWYAFEKFQGERFRWVANDAAFTVESDGKAGTLEAEVQAGPGLGSSEFDLVLKGANYATLLHARGRREALRTHIALARGPNTLHVGVSGGGRVTPGDPRTLNFRVFRISWIPDSQ